MDQDRIDGIGHQLAGAAKARIGRLIGDAKLGVDGATEAAAGKAESDRAISRGPAGGIDPDRVGGIAHQLRGAVKQGFGRLVGDPGMEAKGRAERAAGKMQNAIGSARDEAREALAASPAPAVDETLAPGDSADGPPKT